MPINKLLTLDVSRDADLKTLQEMAKQVKLDGLCDGMDAMEVYTRLDRIRKIRDMEVVAITVDNEIEDVVEIFSRLNSRGTRVTEADIYLGVVAARHIGNILVVPANGVGHHPPEYSHPRSPKAERSIPGLGRFPPRGCRSLLS
jgi:CheY-like chemotaxis protein